MPGAIETVVTVPVLTLGLMAAAAAVAALAMIAFPLLLLGLRRRLDTIETAQAETVNLMAEETKRLAQAIASTKAKQLGEAIQRDRAHYRKKDGDFVDRRDPAKAANRQPLRKTVH